MAQKGLESLVYCDNCQSEYPTDVTVCPDCNQELIAKADTARPVAEALDDSWVAVGKLSGRRLTEQAKNGLDANNIPSMLIPSTFARPFNTPLDGDRLLELSEFDEEKLLMVPREYRIEAKIILRNVIKEEIL